MGLYIVEDADPRIPKPPWERYSHLNFRDPLLLMRRGAAKAP
jgi:hypothetical protein